MPRPSKGVRLYARPSDGGKFIIIDGKTQRRTGTTDRRQAEAMLATYLVERERPGGPTEPDRMSVAAALAIYGEQHAPHVADPARIGHAISALVSWWRDTPVGAVTAAACRRYARERVVYAGTYRERPAGRGTTRRELGCLQAALNYCATEGYLTRAPVVVLPEKKAPTDRWLTRSEVAALIRAARANPRTRHIARFILVAVYTGTRKEAILGLRFEPHPGGGYINVERGVLYRKAEEMRETAKRRPPARMPQKLLRAARRWKRAAGGNGGWAIECRGCRVVSIKTSWRTVCEKAGVRATPHTLKHTAITWAMQAGVPLADAAGFFGTSIQTLESVYLHHHPDFQAATADALDNAKGRM